MILQFAKWENARWPQILPNLAAGLYGPPVLLLCFGWCLGLRRRSLKQRCALRRAHSKVAFTATEAVFVLTGTTGGRNRNSRCRMSQPKPYNGISTANR